MGVSQPTLYKLAASQFGYGSLFSPYDLRISLQSGGIVELGRFSMSAIPNLVIYEGQVSPFLIKIGAMCEFAGCKILVGGAHNNSSIFNLNFGGNSSPFKLLMDPDNRSLCNTQTPQSIVVEDNVVVSTSAMLLGGASVGFGSVIAAGSVVTGRCEPVGIYAGVPARRIRNRFSDPKLLELYKNSHIGEVHASCIPQLPSKLAALEKNMIDIDEYKNSIRFIPKNKRPVIVVEGAVDAKGQIKLTKILEFILGNEAVDDTGALSSLNTYFSQFWKKQAEISWVPDIFDALGLYAP